MTLSSGAKLGRYEIRSKIGEGGMGEVYLAEDTQLHRRVALKILPAELASNRDRMRRFEQEATAAAALNHPNIAHIYEIGSQDDIHFIAMEFVDGQTLRECRHLSYIGAPPDPSNIWLQPATGGEPRQLTDFKSDYIFRHAWSTDGKTLALVRGRGTSDVVLLRDEGRSVP